MKVPAFLLKRLFVRGSLRNTNHGFEFKLRNTLGSGYAYGLLPVTVDGEMMPPDQTVFSIDGKSLLFTHVTKDSPASLSLNREATISVQGRKLTPGPHLVHLGFLVNGVGELRFDAVDSLVER